MTILDLIIYTQNEIEKLKLLCRAGYMNKQEDYAEAWEAQGGYKALEGLLFKLKKAGGVDVRKELKVAKERSIAERKLATKEVVEEKKRKKLQEKVVVVMNPRFEVRKPTQY